MAWPWQRWGGSRRRSPRKREDLAIADVAGVLGSREPTELRLTGLLLLTPRLR